MSPFYRNVAILICAGFFAISAFQGAGGVFDGARLIWDNERTMGRIVSVDGWSPWEAWAEYDTPQGKGGVSFRGSNSAHRPSVGDAVPVMYYPGDPVRVAVRDAQGDLLFRPLVSLMIAAGAAFGIFKLTRPGV
jgi:hypothetical protein